MVMTSHDRKVLWGRAGGRCSMCQRHLVADATATDREAVIGEEAHIVADKVDGPRGDPPLPKAELDAYSNKILLCVACHTIIDSQPIAYTVERLREIKDDHERRIASPPTTEKPEPIKFVYGSRFVALKRLTSGGQIWDVIAKAAVTRFGGIADELSNPEDVDLVDEFFDLARDYNQVSDEVEENGFGAVRDAKRVFGAVLDRLTERGFVVYGGRWHLKVTGGVLPDSPWDEAILQVVLEKDAPRDDEGNLLPGMVGEVPVEK